MKRPYESPRFSKGRVDRAGERIGTPDEVPEDLEALENWRASHANILNTFKTILYNRARSFDGVQIAQRLKRRPTIIDKLKREPGMRLSRMHDIAGCRVIFKNLADLYAFRDAMHNSEFDHKRRGVEDDRWNYIERPKDSGYRGIHDVYTYHVEPKKGRAGELQPWNGMLVEVQYRTAVQHAWATAVELAGLVTIHDPKFNRGSEDFIEFFRLSSEVLARAFEHMTSCSPEIEPLNLIEFLMHAEHETHILSIFSELETNKENLDPRKASLLIFRYNLDLFEERLEIRSFDSVNTAIKEYNLLEEELADKADIVLVGSRSSEAIKSAYRNYFSDAKEFVDLINNGLSILDNEGP